MYQQIFYLTQQESELTALVGTKVFPQTATQKKSLPFVIMNMENEQEVMVMSGGSGVFSCDMVLTCWAETPASAKTIASKIRKAVKNKSGTIQSLNVQGIFSVESGQDLEDQIEGKDTAIYGYQQTFRCWYSQTN